MGKQNQDSTNISLSELNMDLNTRTEKVFRIYKFLIFQVVDADACNGCG